MVFIFLLQLILWVGRSLLFCREKKNCCWQLCIAYHHLFCEIMNESILLTGNNISWLFLGRYFNLHGKGMLYSITIIIFLLPLHFTSQIILYVDFFIYIFSITFILIQVLRIFYTQIIGIQFWSINSSWFFFPQDIHINPSA